MGIFIFVTYVLNINIKHTFIVIYITQTDIIHITYKFISQAKSCYTFSWTVLICFIIIYLYKDFFEKTIFAELNLYSTTIVK
jgi:hypothetical protein